MSGMIHNEPPEDRFGIYAGYYLDAIKRIPTNTSALFFATIATLAGTAIPVLFQGYSPSSTHVDDFNTLVSSHPLIVLAFLLSLLCSVFVTGALILSLSGETFRVAVRRSFSVFLRSIGIEATYFFAIILTFFLLLSPSLFISERSDSLSQLLFLFGFLIYIPILIIFTFTKLYAPFYILLSRTDIRSSVRLGYAFFLDSYRESIRFGFMYISFSLCFFLIAQSIRYAFSFLPLESIGMLATISIVISLFLQTVFLLISKAVWLSFFLHMNTRKEPLKKLGASQEEEKVIQREVPEIG
jgi:hypothetical protein